MKKETTLESQRNVRQLSYKELARLVKSNPTSVRRMCVEGKGRISLFFALCRVLDVKWEIVKKK